jgi:hypothetical protein
VTGLTVSNSHPHLVHVSVCDSMGGNHLSVHVMPTMLDTITWMQQYRQQLEREQQIRQQDPAAQDLFNQYETYMNLVYNK